MEFLGEADTDQINFGVAPPSFVGGTVVDEKGQAVPDAVVQVAAAAIPYPATGGGTFHDFLGDELAPQAFAGRSGPDGRFRIEGIPTNATVDLTVVKEGMALPVGERYFDRNGLRYHPGQNDIKLALESCPGIVEGTILEQGSHAPISGARVWLRAEGSHAYGAPAQLTKSIQMRLESFALANSLLGDTRFTLRSKPTQFRFGMFTPLPWLFLTRQMLPVLS